MTDHPFGAEAFYKHIKLLIMVDKMKNNKPVQTHMAL